jgi:hypothetical protein
MYIESRTYGYGQRWAVAAEMLAVRRQELEGDWAGKGVLEGHMVRIAKVQGDWSVLVVEVMDDSRGTGPVQEVGQDDRVVEAIGGEDGKVVHLEVGIEESGVVVQVRRRRSRMERKEY